MNDSDSSTAPQQFDNLTVIDHPLIRVRLTRLRDTGTSTELFRTNLHEIAQLMLYEATKHLASRETEVETPLATTRGHVPGRPLVLVPILRAGLGMLRGVLHVLPDALIGHIGMFRNEETLEPESYYLKLPPNIEQADVLLIDPMLATGNSSAQAINELKQAGATRITFLCLITCPEGVRAVQAQHPDVPIFTAVVDECLNEQGFIVPGLGDAGDRYFGTV